MKFIYIWWYGIITRSNRLFTREIWSGLPPVHTIPAWVPLIIYLSHCVAVCYGEYALIDNLPGRNALNTEIQSLPYWYGLDPTHPSFVIYLKYFRESFQISCDYILELIMYLMEIPCVKFLINKLFNHLTYQNTIFFAGNLAILNMFVLKPFIQFTIHIHFFPFFSISFL